MENATLVPRVEKKQDVRGEEKGCYRLERAYGAFLRTIPLPQDIDVDGIDARLDKACSPYVCSGQARRDRRRERSRSARERNGGSGPRVTTAAGSFTVSPGGSHGRLPAASRVGAGASHRAEQAWSQRNRMPLAALVDTYCKASSFEPGWISHQNS
ncbi:Hsp20/alpha crystallin family protein [Paraburkholderia terrae]|uniref:Hsp20/alpha crystallin family protein n=1 Tax=Paraburkholderia terrae TaxID=311230 RepID=UPI002852D121|nr:Hsp20/alpha crystallin family protein [Paraburkholderia terrae]